MEMKLMEQIKIRIYITEEKKGKERWIKLPCPNFEAFLPLGILFVYKKNKKNNSREDKGDRNRYISRMEPQAQVPPKP